MDIKEIKEIIEEAGGKFIIIENDEPAFVIMSFEDFKSGIKKNFQQSQAEEKISQTNESVQMIEDEEHNVSQANGEIPEELETEPLKIEDIPF